MIGTIAAISLVALVMIELSRSTLTDAVPWAIFSIALAAVYCIAKEVQQRAATDARARRICTAFPALRHLP